MSVSVDLGFRRYCEKCGIAFYDMFKDPIECPKCLYRKDAIKFSQLKSSRMSIGNAGGIDDEDEDEDTGLEDDISDVDIDDVIDETSDDDDVMTIANSVEDEESKDITLIPNEDTAGEDL